APPFSRATFLRVTRLASIRSRPFGTTEHRPSARLVLIVADLFQPVHGLAIEPLLNRDVRHRRGGRRAVPVFLAGRKPDHVTGPDLLDGPSPTLRATGAGGH